MRKHWKELLKDIEKAPMIHRTISNRGKLALIRSDQYMILAKYYPTALNPHNNSRLINYCIRHSNKEQYI